MSEEVPILPSSEDFWRTHVEASESFKGSNLEYCRLNNLKSSTFGGHKRKFGYVKNPRAKRKTSSVFKKIEVKKPLEVASKNMLDRHSPEWAARFLKELLS